MILALNTSTLQFGLALLMKTEPSWPNTYARRERPFRKPHAGPRFHAQLVKIRDQGRKVHFGCNRPGELYRPEGRDFLSQRIVPCPWVPIVGISSLEAMASQIPYADVPVISVLTFQERRGLYRSIHLGRQREVIRIGEDTAEI